jgi:predicted lipid-binding transport protein (Tim44 family)
MTAFVVQNLKLIMLFLLIGSLIGLSHREPKPRRRRTPFFASRGSNRRHHRRDMEFNFMRLTRQ